MSWVITAIVVTGAVSARGQYVAGKQQEIQYKEQAEQEKIASEGRELERRQQLNRTLAANIVSQSASGISTEGTPESIMLESSKKASASESIIGLSDKLKQAQLRRAGKYAKQTGYLQAASTLLNSATTAAMVGD